jgi:hypothetical protein
MLFAWGFFSLKSGVVHTRFGQTISESQNPTNFYLQLVPTFVGGAISITLALVIIILAWKKGEFKK